jgi:hypothetical protein
VGIMETRICYICKKEFPLTDEFFYKDKTHSKGLDHKCKKCSYLKLKERRKNNPEKQRKIQHNQYKYSTNKMHTFINQYKLEMGCSICGYSEHPSALDFHHVNNDKEYSISTMVNQRYSKQRILNEMKKCIVVCANCHRIIHSRYTYEKTN